MSHTLSIKINDGGKYDLEVSMHLEGALIRISTIDGPLASVEVSPDDMRQLIRLVELVSHE